MAPRSYDIYRLAKDVTPVNFEAGELTGIQGKAAVFSACRVLEGGRAGYYATSTLGDEEIIRRAAEMAPYGPEVDIDLPGPVELGEAPAFSEETANLTADDLVAWGRRITEGLGERLGSDLPVNVALERGLTRKEVRNSEGVAYTHVATGLTVSAELSEAREGDIHVVFDLACSSESADLDPDRMVRYMADYYRMGSETTSLAKGEMPVLLHPFAVPQFLKPLLVGLDGEKVKDGVSPLVNLRGEQIFHEGLTMWDDPFLPGSPGSAPFDAEGVAARKRPLLARGVLKSFNHTLETARATGREPTGGARRGVGGKPAPGTFNLVMEAGEAPHEEILGSIDRGLLLRYMSGSGQANNLAGEFSMGVLAGYLIEGGRPVKRLKSVMVAGNVYETFRNVAAVSSDRIQSGGDGGGYALMPYVLLEGVAVAGV